MFIETAIKKAKVRLIKQAEKNGLCENFGQDEVRILEKKYVDFSKVFGDSKRLVESAKNCIAVFDEWCMNYTIK